MTEIFPHLFLRISSSFLADPHLLPSDTKLLLTMNYSEIISFDDITNLTCNSLKVSFFPRYFETTKFLKNYEKRFSCQRV